MKWTEEAANQVFTVFRETTIEDLEDFEKAVKTTGYSVQDLSTHPDWRIRGYVATSGYCLETLVNDEHAVVAKIASMVLAFEKDGYFDRYLRGSKEKGGINK